MYCSAINRELTTLSLDCKLKDSGGKAAIGQVLDTLKKESRYSIDRVTIAGSVGKKTALEGSDFDAVVFVNFEEPGSRTAIIKEFKSLLASRTLARNLDHTNFAVKFKLNGFDVDLLPVRNYVTGQRMDTQSQQAEAVAALLQQDPSKYYSYSAALAESQVGFMKEQTGFVHELVILCKYWNRKVDVPDLAEDPRSSS